jgi:hypothetical protein
MNIPNSDYVLAEEVIFMCGRYCCNVSLDEGIK